MDQVVNAATARSMQVLGILDYTPAWAAIAGATNDHFPPADPATFATFAQATVLRYKNRVHTWEIWNEPNISQFWQPKPNVTAYTALLKAASITIKAADPSAQVVSAGLSPAADATDGSQVAPVTFLTGIYANGGKGS